MEVCTVTEDINSENNAVPDEGVTSYNTDEIVTKIHNAFPSPYEDDSDSDDDNGNWKRKKRKMDQQSDSSCSVAIARCTTLDKCGSLNKKVESTSRSTHSCLVQNPIEKTNSTTAASTSVNSTLSYIKNKNKKKRKNRKLKQTMNLHSNLNNNLLTNMQGFMSSDAVCNNLFIPNTSLPLNFMQLPAAVNAITNVPLATQMELMPEKHIEKNKDKNMQGNYNISCLSNSPQFVPHSQSLMAQQLAQYSQPNSIINSSQQYNNSQTIFHAGAIGLGIMNPFNLSFPTNFNLYNTGISLHSPYNTLSNNSNNSSSSSSMNLPRKPKRRKRKKSKSSASNVLVLTD